MITSRTITASSPVAAWRSSADMLSLREPTIRTAMHHVIKVATNARPAPKATGRRCTRFGPVILAVIAANTRMHSNPSRKTRTPISRNATVGLVLGRNGSGAPCSVTPCQIKTATTAAAARQRTAAITPERRRALALAVRQCGEQGAGVASTAGNFAVALIPFTRQNYHIRPNAAAGRLPFFSGVLPSTSLLLLLLFRMRDWQEQEQERKGGRYLVICRRGRNFCAMPFQPHRHGGFTLVELAIAVVILVLLMMLAVPSMNGVLADRRLRRSLDGFNAIVRQAQERSTEERRAYLITWYDGKVSLRPEGFRKGESAEPLASLKLNGKESLKISF